MPESSDEFYRIQKLPPYVFAVINEMRAKARAAQIDVIDLGMGNPDGATPRAMVNKLVEAARNRAQPSLLAVARHSQTARGDHPPLPGQLRRDARSREGSHRHHRRQGRAGAPAVRHRRAGRRGGFAQPRLSDPSVRRDHGRRPCLHASHAGCRHVSQPAGRPLPHGPRAKPEDAADLLPAQPDHDLRGSGFLPRDRPPGAPPRHHGRSRFRLRRPGLRRLQAAQHSAGGGRQGSGRRDLLDVEELQHGRLARGLLPGQSEDDRRAGAHQELPGLRRLPAHPDRVASSPCASAKRTPRRSAPSTRSGATCWCTV